MRERNTWSFSPWKVGDKVWLEAMNLHLNYSSRKLAPKRQGPFKIAQVLSPLTYRLRLPSAWKIHDVFHASLLLSYKETETHGPNFLKPPPDLIDAEEEYKVEQIISHRGPLGRWKYLLRTSCPCMISPTFSFPPTPNLTYPSMISSPHRTDTGTYPHSSQTPRSLRRNSIPFLDASSMFHLSCFRSVLLLFRLFGPQISISRFICFPL